MKLEVWFDFASTYSYLTALRVEDVVRDAGLAMEWKPFLLGPIFQVKGWSTSPFLLDPIKGAYMWRDVARRADKLKLKFTRPDTVPAHSVLAARVMTGAISEGWASDFAKDVFLAEFGEGKDIADPMVLRDALKRHVSDPDHWLDLAQSDGVRATLRSTTQEAMQLGIFGAPTFRVGDEIFWGDDRLEDAVEWLADRSAST